MTSLVLFQYLRHDREGIVPVDTFEFPGRAVAGNGGELDDINGYLEDILSRFVEESLEVGQFWVAPKDEFDPEEQSGYGLTYAMQQYDSRLTLPKDTYQAALTLVAYILRSESWENVSMNDVYTLTDYKESDIPLSAPETPPAESFVDKRYQVGDVLTTSVNSNGVVYAGVLVRPHVAPATDASWEWADADRTSVFIGLADDSFVKLDALNAFPTQDFKVHPLPSIALRHVKKGTKWFTVHPDYKNLEGYGPTQKLAKRELALKILLNGTD